MSSTLLCGPCTPFASCRLTGCRCLLCNRCSTLLSSLSSPMPLASPAWWGFTTSTDRHRIDAVLRRANRSGFWTSAVPSDFPTFEDLCSTADDEFLLKLPHSRTTYYTFFAHHEQTDFAIHFRRQRLRFKPASFCRKLMMRRVRRARDTTVFIFTESHRMCRTYVSARIVCLSRMCCVTTAVRLSLHITSPVSHESQEWNGRICNTSICSTSEFQALRLI